MKSKLLIAAMSAALGIASVPAHAGTVGVADLIINNLVLVNASNGQLVTSGITVLSDARTGIADSNFNGTSGTGVGAGSISSFNPGATVDVQHRCAGPDCGSINAIYGGSAENKLGTNTLAAGPLGNFAVGDMFIGGSALGAASGANGLTRANVSVTGATNEGGSSSTIINSASALTATFTVGETIDVLFSLGYEAFVMAFVDTAPGIHGHASAGINWVMTVTSSDDPSFAAFSWLPEELNVGYTSTDASENQEYFGAGQLFSDVRTLTAGKKYNLTITQASNALASEIPEPASLALVGLGLLGIGALRRRRAA